MIRENSHSGLPGSVATNMTGICPDVSSKICSFAATNTAFIDHLEQWHLAWWPSCLTATPPPPQSAILMGVCRNVQCRLFILELR